MEIELKTITLRELYAGYENNEEDGRVVAYGGKLNIRPPYQREFVYKDQQRNEVIRTASKGFPLNVMYWAQREDGTFEVLDGQQRTLSHTCLLFSRREKHCTKTNCFRLNYC